MADDEALLDLLQQAHLTRVLIGIESLNQKALNLIHKVQNIENIRKAGAACEKHGIRVIASIVLGLDDDTKEDIHRSIQFAKDIHACQLQPAILTPYPGTPVYEDMKREGLLTRKEFADYMMENPTDFYYGVLWNKFFRRDLIVKNEIKMNADINWCEDFLFNLEYILYADSIYVLPTPVYYYRNRKGSLSSQGWNILKTVQMKLTVFECYNEFYKSVYDEQDYRKRRLQIYRFLFDAANDNAAAPTPFSSAQKRKNITLSVSSEISLCDDSLIESYYSRKLQKLSTMDYIQISEVRKKEKRKSEGTGTFTGVELHIHFLPASERVLSDLAVVQLEMNEVQLEGFTEEERVSYEGYLKRIRDNSLRALSL